MKNKHKIFALGTAASLLCGSLSLSGITTAFAVVQPNTITEGYYLIQNVNSRLYLSANSITDSANVDQQELNGATFTNEEIWKITLNSDGNYQIHTATAENLVLSADTANAPNLCVSTNNNITSQEYAFYANTDGSFRVVSANNSQAMEVKNAYTTAGGNVQLWEQNGVNCQDWNLIPVSYKTATAETTGEKIEGFQPEGTILGDCNGDGVVNGMDLALLRCTSNQVNYALPQITSTSNVGDVNADKMTDLADHQKLENYLLKTDSLAELEPETSSSRYVYPAVNGTYTNGVSESTNTGFTYDSYLNLDNVANLDTSYSISGVQDGTNTLTIRYANGGTTNRDMILYVGNYAYQWNLSFPTTGSWTTWEEVTVNIPLSVTDLSTVTLVATSESGAPNLDYLAVTASDTDWEQDATALTAITGVPNADDGTVAGENTNNVYGVGRQMEDLNRGVVAAYTGSGVLVSWRSLATDADGTTFKLYKNGTFVADISETDATNYFVSGATSSDSFTVDTFVNGTMTEFANAATMIGNKNSGQSGAYMDIPLDTPANQTMPDGSTCYYTPNDASVGDVDGDGEYEIILKWNPSNAQDNSNSTVTTGTVFLDCYKMDGTKLWRINLGINIRAGAHYTQFMVYDFDGDGKAELMCKTADGTYDGKGVCIGSSTVDNRSSGGTILTGNEYLTLFDGETGAALDTINYEPSRGTQDKSTWGDNYGNRSERYLAAVAYLDGKTPSAIFCRGYYTRAAVVAYNVVNKKIVKQWMYDTGFNSSDGAYGQGNHSVVVMDVDQDGKDEIVYGSCCFESDGTLKWSTGLGHGDCMQAGDLFPDREGLEIFQVHEEVWCAEVHDAATGEILWRVNGSDDVGRGIALNMSSAYSGMEFASVADGLIYYWDSKTNSVQSTGYAWTDKIKWSQNSAVWWDGTLERSSLDRTMVEKMDVGRQFTGDGCSYNNSTKANACLTADIFGDWREEMIFQTAYTAGSESAAGTYALRVCETTYTTETKLFTLMHDSQYRTGVAIENVAYNQAPNTSFFLGTGYDLPETPTVYTPSSKK